MLYGRPNEPKNRIVKNTSRKINGVLGTYLQETRRKEA